MDLALNVNLVGLGMICVTAILITLIIKLVD